MSTLVVLPEDLTGNASSNRITDEPHELSLANGRCFALNYGGFYSASLIIRKDGIVAPLQPVVDYVVVAPYDHVTNLSGKEAACGIVILGDTWAGNYAVTYQAVGGQYATNVDALRQVLEDFSQSTASVHWNAIVGKPLGYETAPHLVDFRSQVFGFEGLINAIREISDGMHSVHQGEAAAILSSVSSLYSPLFANFSNVTNLLANRIYSAETNINLNTQAIGNKLTGRGASASDIETSADSQAYLRASNIADILIRAIRHLNVSAMANPAVGINAPHLYPRTWAEVNLRVTGVVGNNIPNFVLRWYFVSNSVPVTSTITNYYQEAFCSSEDGRLPIHARRMGARNSANGVYAWGPWERSDGNVFSFATDAQAQWTTAEDNTVSMISAAQLKKLTKEWYMVGTQETNTTAVVDNTDKPVILVSLNLFTTSDGTVPNRVISWRIETQYNGMNGAAATIVRRQIGYGENNIIIMRVKHPTNPEWSQWTRVDRGAVSINVLNGATPEELAWATVEATTPVSGRWVKEFIRANIDKVDAIGTIKMFASPTNFVPAGTVACDGRLLDRLQYPVLFNLLGTVFGTSTSSNFAVPDLRGVVVRGWDARAPAAGNRDIDRVALTNNGFGTYQTDAMIRISGSVDFDQNPEYGLVNGATGVFTAVESRFRRLTGDGTGATKYNGFTMDTYTAMPTKVSLQETRMRNVAMQFVIRVQSPPA